MKTAKGKVKAYQIGPNDAPVSFTTIKDAADRCMDDFIYYHAGFVYVSRKSRFLWLMERSKELVFDWGETFPDDICLAIMEIDNLIEKA